MNRKIADVLLHVSVCVCVCGWVCVSGCGVHSLQRSFGFSLIKTLACAKCAQSSWKINKIAGRGVGWRQEAGGSWKPLAALKLQLKS